MRSRALAFICAATLAGPLVAAEPPSAANEALLHSARMWEAHDRGDLARLALEKLVAARPDSPDVLLALGELNLRMTDVPAAARVLDTLQKRFPASEATRTFATEYRLATRERLQLASLQRLIQLNRGADARRELQRLFGGAPTQGTVAIEYYRLLAGTPEGWAPARAGLQQLIERHPDEPRYRMALAQLLLRREETKQEGLRELYALMPRNDVRPAQLDDALANAIVDVGYERVPADILRNHLSRHPEDAAATAALSKQTLAREEEQLLAKGALAHIEPTLQSKNLEQAAQVARDQQHSHVSALLAAVQGRAFDVVADDALAIAAWRRRAQASLQQNERPRAVLELEAALAFARKDFEGVIPIAEKLEKTQTDESGELLAQAVSLDPGSNWLFETYVRWLIAHDRGSEAVPLLEAREKSSAAHDGLLASALDARAQSFIAAGRTNDAVTDLERATRLQPDAVWPRYRLAGLYAQRGERERSRALLHDRVDAEPGSEEARYAYALYLSSIDDVEGALAALNGLSAAQRTTRVSELNERLVREQSLQKMRALQRDRRFVEAAALLDELIAREPKERSLRIARAELDLDAGNARSASDRYAGLVAEHPDDVDTRLAYVRALLQANDLPMARVQLAAARERIAADDADRQMTVAYRQWSLGETDEALRSVQAVLRVKPNAPDALLTAARLELSLGHYAAANDYFSRAEAANDASAVQAARLARAELDSRLQDWAAGGVEMRHKPGDRGISSFDSIVMPTLWQYAPDYERKFWVHADAVALDAGRLSATYDDAALFGTIAAAGPNAARRTSNARQTGVSLGVGYATDRFSMDVGTTPLGFLLPQVVGGFEWTPQLSNLALAMGVSRRAVTSSVLSYAGMRDPITGTKWGAVLDSGVYAQAGVYREHYSVSGSMRIAELQGHEVSSNRFLGSRLAADRTVVSWPSDRAYVGVAVTYWNYERELSHYTFGNGGYYSPQSYWSVSLPLEWQGKRGQWSYRVRAAVAHSTSRTDRAPFYRDDALQANASASALPSGYDEPLFEGGHSSGTSLSGYAAVERSLTPALALGAKLDIDRADYYEPTVFMLYARHVFGTRTTELAVPPRPVRPYSEQR